MLTACSSCSRMRARLLHVALAVGPALGHHALDLGVLAGMQGREGEVLQLPADRLDAQAVSQRRVDLQRLLGLLDLLLLAQIAERAHVVQPVGQLDEDHPDVLGHGDDHLADVLGLLFLDRAEGHLRQLGDAVDEQGHLVAELLAHRLDGQLGVFDHVVQQRGGDGGAVEPQVGADVGRAHGMVDVGLAAGPQLVLMLRRGHVEGAHDQIAVETGIVLLDLGEKAARAAPRWTELSAGYATAGRLPWRAAKAGWSLQVQAQSGALLIVGFRLRRRPGCCALLV